MSTEQVADQESEESVEQTTTVQAEGQGDREPVQITRAPPRKTQVIALVAAVIGAALTAPFAILAAPFGIAGLVLVASALFVTHSRSWLSAGTAFILVAALVTGAFGALSPEFMLLGVGATVLAWDVGQHGIVIGNQLGRQTASDRTQLVHTAISTFVIGTISMLAYLIFLVAGEGRHASAVAIGIIGVVLMAWVFRS